MERFHSNEACKNEFSDYDDITSVTARGETERAASVIDDDVGPESRLSFLDLFPVKESNHKNVHNDKEIEIIDVYTKSRLDEKESFTELRKEKNWIKEVDEYDLNNRGTSSADYNRFSDDNFQTVVQRFPPSVTLTRHEPTPVMSKLRQVQPRIESENIIQLNGSSDSSDIGRQITQLALRIESLGNISRVYQNEQASNVIHQCPPRCTRQMECETKCNEHVSCDQNSLKTARKLDNMERLQKRQEAMQNRLTDLAKKLNDSTKDLTRPMLYNANVSNNEDFHTGLPKTSRKLIKKGTHKGSKAKKVEKSSFLNNILNDVGEAQTNEVPLLSSTYCLHNDLSTGSPESVVTDASKYLNDELNNIRLEFRTQVEEIRRLLSERYQKTTDDLPKEQVIQPPHLSLADEIDKSITKIRRDTSPSLRNITNVSRYEDEYSPLDKYLTRRPLEYQLPSLDSDITPSLRPGILPSVAKAIRSKQRMLSDPIEAERFLVEIRNRRANLENNINCLERAKDGQFLFSILEKLQGNENSFAMARIQAMVDDAIVSVNPEIQWEVKQEFQSWLDKRHQRQIQQDIEDSQQNSGKRNPPKSTKIVQHINYNQNYSTASVAQKPWLCKKYGAVRSKVDTGLRKPEPKVQRSISPAKAMGGKTQVGNSTWSNRRRYRTPYLHFVNDIKLAKKSIGPLGDENRNMHMIESSTKRRKSSQEKAVHDDSLILLGVRQYSLDYLEEEDKVERPQLIAKATSPRSESKKSSVDDDTETERNKRNHRQEVSERSKQSKVPKRPHTPPSPSLSEIGTGFHLKSSQSSKPREERVGPFVAIDPLEEKTVTSRPINVLSRRPERRTEPDINDLRLMIEKAIYDQIEIPSPTTSTDLPLSPPKGNVISTPRPSTRDNYSEDFGTESIKDKTDYSMTLAEGVKTPDVSYISLDHDKYRRLNTPLGSPTRSVQVSPKRQIIPEKISEAIQTISDKGIQTIEDKGMQTSSPARTQTPNERKDPESVDSFSTTSGLEESLSDTQVDSFSDGMWLLDRSEGEMAKHYVLPVSRWNLGSCPDNPMWPHGTDELTRLDRQSVQSFGEFVKPTLSGLIPTMDGVLQLKTFPFKQRYDSINFDDDNTIPYSNRQSKHSDFNLIRMSRDSKSKFNTPRSERRSPGHSQDSHGEVQLRDESEEEDYMPIKIHRNKTSKESDDQNNSPQLINTKDYNDSYNTEQTPGDRSALFQPDNFRRSNESNLSDVYAPFKESYSDRMKIDPMKYLRGSKQSQSDFSDTGGLLSTGQVIAAAFNGGDSADFDVPSDRFPVNHNSHYKEPGSRLKPTVIIPTLESIDQSERSQSEISEILLPG